MHAIDPVCGADVDPRSAPRVVHSGGARYFCSERCRNAFLDHPELYLKDAPDPPVPASCRTDSGSEPQEPFRPA